MSISPDIDPVNKELYGKALEVTGSLLGITQRVRTAYTEQKPVSVETRISLTRKRMELSFLIESLRDYKNEALRPLRAVIHKCEAEYENALLRLATASSVAGEAEHFLAENGRMFK